MICVFFFLISGNVSFLLYKISEFLCLRATISPHGLALSTIPFAKCAARTSKLRESLCDSRSNAVAAYFYLVSRSSSSFLRVRDADGNQRQQFVTFYEISTLAVVEFISSPAAIRERKGKGGGNRGMDAGYVRAFFFFFFSYYCLLGRGSRLALP